MLKSGATWPKLVPMRAPAGCTANTETTGERSTRRAGEQDLLRRTYLRKLKSVRSCSSRASVCVSHTGSKLHGATSSDNTKPFSLPIRFGALETNSSRSKCPIINSAALLMVANDSQAERQRARSADKSVLVGRADALQRVIENRSAGTQSHFYN